MDLSLTKLELDILRYLSKKEDFVSLDEVVNALKENKDKISKFLLFLSNKGYVTIKKIKEKRIEPTEKGTKYLNEDLPDDKLLELCPCEVKKLDKELTPAIKYLKKEGIITIENGIIKVLKNVPSKYKTKKFRKCIQENILDPEFLDRGLIKQVEKESILIKITDLGKKVVNELKDVDLIEKVTKDIILNQTWKNKKFRWYDVESPVPYIQGGKKHPLKEFVEYIKEILISMGFEEIEGPWVETAFWNMDIMFIPQDHPAREVQDTMYLEKPKYCEKLPSFYKKVKEIHERNYKIKWSEEEAKKYVLRSHTTAATFRKLADKINIPGKYFCIGRVFRNETIDWKHLAEFYQIEGFVVGNVNLRHLIGFMKEFYKNFGITKLKFKPTYNPYTEPSLEVFGYYPKKQTWVEIANSGIFRPETLEPLGIKHNIIAWGLALERLYMLVEEIEDIRDVWGTFQKLDKIYTRTSKIWHY